MGICQCHFSNGDGVEKSSSRNCFDFLRFEMPILMSAFRQNMFGLRKLFKNPCSQAELNKIVPFGFSLQRQKMVFFCHQNSKILLC